MTNKTLILIPFLIINIVLSVSSLANDSDTGSQTIGVRQFMTNFDKYSSQDVKIEGVVSKINKKQNIIGLIDIQELKECRVVTCARLMLPVRWDGNMPQIKNKVFVSGKAQKEKQGYVFIAKRLIVNESK